MKENNTEEINYKEVINDLIYYSLICLCRFLIMGIGLFSSLNLHNEGHNILCWIIFILSILIANLYGHIRYNYLIDIHNIDLNADFNCVITSNEYINIDNKEEFNTINNMIQNAFKQLNTDSHYEVNNISYIGYNYKYKLFKVPSNYFKLVDEALKKGDK